VEGSGRFEEGGGKKEGELGERGGWVEKQRTI